MAQHRCTKSAAPLHQSCSAFAPTVYHSYIAPFTPFLESLTGRTLPAEGAKERRWEKNNIQANTEKNSATCRID